MWSKPHSSSYLRWAVNLSLDVFHEDYPSTHQEKSKIEKLSDKAGPRGKLNWILFSIMVMGYDGNKSSNNDSE